MEINPTSGSIEKTYIYANSQIIAQHDGDHTVSRYFYMHDRLGSVRQIINTSAGIVKYYTYEPFGETIEHGGTFDNPFQFTGQFFDSEIDEYYLRARQYNPHIARFITRDPVFGKFREPLTLHVYLYCENEPVNLFDPDGSSSRSAALGVEQYSFELYMCLWNEIPRRDIRLWTTFLWTFVNVAVKGGLEYWAAPAGSTYGVFSAGLGPVMAGPDIYRIMFYRLLQHGMINAVLREDFGISSDFYDIQDYRVGL